MKRGNTALKRGVGLASAFALAIAGAVIAAPAASAATDLGAAGTFDNLIRTAPTADAQLLASGTGDLVTKATDVNSANTYATTSTGALPVVGVGSSQDIAGIQLLLPGSDQSGGGSADTAHWATGDTFKVKLSNEATFAGATVSISKAPVVTADLAKVAGVANSTKYLGLDTASAASAASGAHYVTGALQDLQGGTVSITTDGDTATVKFNKADKNVTASGQDSSAEAYLITISGVKVNVSNRAAAAAITASVVGGDTAKNTTTIGYVLPYALSIADGAGYPANSSDPLALPAVSVKETSVNGFNSQNFVLRLSGDEASTGSLKYNAGNSTWTPSSYLDVDSTGAGDKATVAVGAGTAADADLAGTGTSARIDNVAVSGLKINGLKAGADATLTLEVATGLSAADASSWASSPDQDLTAGPSVKISEVVEAPRIAGDNRYETAADIAAEYAGDNPLASVILANGTDAKLGIDALSANFLAGDADAPILLTDAGKTLPAATADALKSLFKDSAGDTDGEINIYVMGAEADSVSKEAADQAKQIVTDAANSGVSKVNIVRLAGSDRFDTAAKAAQEGSDNLGAVNLGSGNYNTAFLASGLVNADALAAGAISAAAGFPVLLTNGTTIGDSTAKAIDDLNIQQLIVLGGPDRVSDELIAKLKADNGIKNVVRIAGSGAYGRYNTAALLNEWAFGAANLTQGTGVFLASGFADALAAGPYVGQTAGTPNVLLTIPGSVIPDLPQQTLKGLTGVKSVTALGGTDRITDAVIVQAQKLVLG